jgi:hypothetical protein
MTKIKLHKFESALSYDGYPMTNLRYSKLNVGDLCSVTSDINRYYIEIVKVDRYKDGGRMPRKFHGKCIESNDEIKNDEIITFRKENIYQTEHRYDNDNPIIQPNRDIIDNDKWKMIEDGWINEEMECRKQLVIIEQLAFVILNYSIEHNISIQSIRNYLIAPYPNMTWFTYEQWFAMNKISMQKVNVELEKLNN